MENTNNTSLAIMDENDSFIADLTSAKTMFCSIKAETDAERAIVFNATNNPEKRIADCINTVIHVKDLFCEVVPCTNKETGEVTTCPRTILIDEKGVGHVAVSRGVFNAIKKVIALYGAPTWETPIPLEVKQISKGERKILTFNVKTK